MKKLSFLTYLHAASLIASGHAAAINLVDAAYTVDTALPADNQYFLEGGAAGTTATWTIDPGVTVTGGRYFIASGATAVTGVPDIGVASFVVTGGGSLRIERIGTFNIRLGQSNTSEPGALVIKGGSSVLMTGTTASVFEEESTNASSITLEGIGSTFRWAGTWDAANNKVVSQNGAANAVPVKVVGGLLAASTPASGFSQLTVVASAPDPALTLGVPAQQVSDGRPVSFTVPFSNTGATRNLLVTAVNVGGVDATAFTVDGFTSPVAPGATGQIRVTCAPDIGGGIYQAELTVETNSSVNPIQVIGMSVKVSDPALSITTERLDFGTLAANPAPAQLSVPVTNTGGTEELQIDAQVLGESSPFSVVSAPAVIAPGATANIVVSFNPGAQSGTFGNLLRIDSNSFFDPDLTIPLMAEVLPPSTLPTTLVVTNGDFEANQFNSGSSTAPGGWTSSLVGVAGIYGESAIPGYTGIPALFWAKSGSYIQQDLTTANPGLTANKITRVAVALSRGYRNDTVTQGDILLYVSLRDLATDAEIAGRFVTIEDQGVQTGANRNLLTATKVVLPISSTSTGGVALRIETREPMLTANEFSATAIIDNVSMTIAGSYVPSASPFVTWATANGLDGTPGKESGTADDPDHDGISNFEEFAFGANPLSPASRGLLAVVTQDTDADARPELLLTVAVRSGAAFSGSPSPTATKDGVVYSIQGGTGLTAFDSVVEGPLTTPIVPASLPATAPIGYEYRSFRLAGSNALPGRGFLRASVSAAAP